jgi:hypothetical protein
LAAGLAPKSQPPPGDYDPGVPGIDSLAWMEIKQVKAIGCLVAVGRVNLDPGNATTK